jgi:predicted RNA-binding protein YlxR (DUF448 family)
MCVGCRTVRERDQLIRIAAVAGKPVHVDADGRAGGRGAYICRRAGTTCLATALRKRSLARALRATPDLIDNGGLAAGIGALTTQED